MIRYVVGDATNPMGAGKGPVVIAHVCNDVCGWGAGFVLAISKRWPKPEASYRSWGRLGSTREEIPLKHTGPIIGEVPFILGHVQFVEVAEHLWVANMIAQVGYGSNNTRKHKDEDDPDRNPPIRYAALKECLFHVRNFAMKKGSSVHMPRIGCGLAGGNWGQVGPIVDEALLDESVFVYDLP